MNYDVNAWINENDFIKQDNIWYNTMPYHVKNPTYYYDRLGNTKYSKYYNDQNNNNENNQNNNNFLTLLKLSHQDVDPYYLMDAASIRIARCLETDTYKHLRNGQSLCV